MASSASLLGADGHSATLDRATAQFECSAAAQLSCANHSNTPAMSIGKSPSRWISDGQIFHEFSTVVCRPDENPHVPSLGQLPGKPGAGGAPNLDDGGNCIKIVRAVMTTFSQRVVAVCRSVAF
jgi:hypothetical protein